MALVVPQSSDNRSPLRKVDIAKTGQMRGHACRILVIDDDPDFASSLVDLLGEQHQVEIADSFFSAAKILDSFAADLALVDIHLGQSSGLDLIPRLQQKQADILCILMTAHASVQTAVQALQRGAFDYLLKPFDENELLAAVHRASKHHLLKLTNRNMRLALDDSESRFRDLVEGSIQGIYVRRGWDILFANQAFARIFGFVDAHAFLAGGLSLEEMLTGEGQRAIKTNEVLLDDDTSNSEYELEVIRNDGDIRVLQSMERSIIWDGEAAIQATVIDISERKSAERKLHYQAKYDALTGLANRTLFYDALGSALARAKRSDRKIAVLFMDLDHFKQVNDLLGHEVGDLLLQGVAKRVRGCVRRGDLLARLGGDEFAVIVDEIHESHDAGKAAQKILDALSLPIVVNDEKNMARCSIGIATYPENGILPSMLVKCADTAMYEAKRLGRNNYQYFAPEMQEQAVIRSILEYDLTYALHYGQFRLYFQPIVRAGSQQIVGAEALLRWQHDRRGLLMPQDFISVAEDSGHIVNIGRWVVQTACLQMRDLQDACGLHNLSISVNVSVRQLKDQSFVDTVMEALEAARLNPAQMELEITETVLMEDRIIAVGVLERLHALGVRIAIDDFGTGYSSLVNLRKLPIDTLKIDRSFVRDLGENEDAAVIVKTTINLAKNLGLKIIAEGVENAQQAEFLTANDCDWMQGFYFSEPLPLPVIKTKYHPD